MSEALAADPPFVGALAGFADTIRWSEERSDEADIGANLRPHLLRHHASAGGPWRAACSLWGQIYFNTLLIPATCLLAPGWSDRAFARRLTPWFCPASGLPLRFTVQSENRCDLPAESAFVQRLGTHVARVINELAEEGRLSKPMLWEGAGLAIRWAAAELTALRPTFASRLRYAAHRLETESRFALAWRGGGAETPRKFCCLRYQLEGYATCSEICPRRKLIR